MRWMMLITIGLVVLMLPAMAGCDVSGGLRDAGRAIDRVHEQDGPAQSPSTAAVALRWGGSILMFAGLAIVASRFLGYLTAPLIGGVLTIGAGIASITLADLLARFWWMGPVILLGLVAIAVVEWLNDRDLLSRDPRSLLPEAITPTALTG